MVDTVKAAQGIDAPRTRRTLLAAAAAAGAATVAGAFAKPLQALAAPDDNADMYVGVQYANVSQTTGLTNPSSGTTVFSATSNFGTAVLGTSSSGSGGAGVYGVSASGLTSGIAVRAAGGAGRGVVADSAGYIALHGISTSGTALRAESTSGYGVDATSGSNTALRASSNTGQGAYIYGGSASLPAVQGVAGGGSAGVQGHSGASAPTARANTGVQGTAAGSGTGGYFESATGNAIRVQGRASFSRAGRSTIAKNKSYVDITPLGGLATTALVLATLQTPRGSACVASVRTNYPTAGKARIYLNKVASTTASTYVAWIVLG